MGSLEEAISLTENCVDFVDQATDFMAQSGAQRGVTNTGKTRTFDVVPESMMLQRVQLIRNYMDPEMQKQLKLLDKLVSQYMQN